ncbi:MULTISPECIES: hypothetical protein [unclassified Myxococcus]|nr:MULTISPECIES: hypothetical protein [unclassified Myxococcus]
MANSEVMAKSIKVAVDVSRGIAVHAKGDPATIVAVGAAAGVAFLAISVGAAVWYGARAAWDQS